MAEELTADYYENILSFTKLCKNLSYFHCGVQSRFSSSLKKAGAKNAPAKPGDVASTTNVFLNCTPGRVQRPGVLVVVVYFTI
ncbi:MAG TPA: hypothetical protein VFR08_15625 [Candidatus Angelobacter sp.]|nr:hypothetical protein [Candidatus Angelobacter sp.]